MFPGASEYDLDITIDAGRREQLLSIDPADVSGPDTLTYARNVFVPLTTACRYSCAYCEFFDPPGEATLRSPEEIREICRQGADAGCTEALFTFGDDPDDRYSAIHDQLAEWGHDSIHSYLREACEIALEEGLLPHANPGDQTPEQMDLVAEYTASMGVMLETTADVDAHAGRRSKDPGQRLATIQTAGKLGVPFTTGILVGIGENWRDRAESILAIRALHERFGHIQEVIVQPVAPNDRWQADLPDLATMRRTVAMARAGLPEEVSVQVPPNLARTQALIECGVGDLGGISPVTDDHVNPAHAWPDLADLRSIAEDAGVSLQERLAVYPRYVDEQWLGDPVLNAIRDDAGGRVSSILERWGERRPPE